MAYNDALYSKVSGFWTPSRTSVDPSIPYLPLETPAAAATSQPSTSRRNLLLTGVLATWAVVTATPLFAAVGLQVTPVVPPPRNDIRQAAVHHSWIPPAWTTPRARTVPTSGPAERVPVLRHAAEIASAWDAPTLTSIWKISAYQDAPTVTVTVPFSRASSQPIASWSPDAWDAQHVRTLTSSGPESAAPQPARRPALDTIQSSWTEPTATPLWTSFGAQEGPAVVTPDNPPIRYPVLGHVYAQWEQPSWPAQRSFQSTTSGPAPVADNPPPRSSLSRIYARWDDSATVQLWGTFSAQTGPTVLPPDNPPIRYPRLPHIYQQWEPAPLSPVWGGRLLLLDGSNLTTRRAWFFDVCAAWEPEPPTPTKRTVFTASGPELTNLVPLRRDRLWTLLDTWTPAPHPAIIIQPGTPFSVMPDRTLFTHVFGGLFGRTN